MYLGKLLFVQVMNFLPWKTFHRIVDRYGGDHRTRSLSCAEQFRVMAFAQLTYRESLRDIEVCLAAQAGKLYHMGIGAAVAGFSLNSLRSRARSACSVSDCKLTDTYSPAAIAMAPATSPATPAIKTPFWFAAAALVRGSQTRVPYQWNEKPVLNVISIGVHQAERAQLRNAPLLGATHGHHNSSHHSSCHSAAWRRRLVRPWTLVR